ncbi:MAG: DNA-processing protein DprA, partial [Spirochaetia bacterium]|nr:DNA-processing protein DprA [Spirochaetia bacterium]
MIKGIKYWIALEQTGGIGPVNLREIHKTLLSMNLSIEDLFGCSKEEIIREFHFSEKLSSLIESAKNTAARIDNDCLVLADAKISVIPFFAPEYPSKLLNIMGNSFPPILYVIGDASILGKKGIALLGGGEISAVGETILFASARELARHNIIIISGMAKGADLIAHRAAMVSGGKTAAFIPGGMFHFKIPEFILEAMTPDNLVVVSPFFPSKEMNKFNAFTRNRIICALSYAVFIVETTADEGIFDAAKSAQKLGVPLYTTEYSKYPESAKGNPLIL